MYYLLFLGMMVIKSLVIRKSLQGRRVLQSSSAERKEGDVRVQKTSVRVP